MIYFEGPAARKFQTINGLQGPKTQKSEKA
jgi:hypothetical protein